MATPVENPFDTQPAKPTNGIVGGVINSAANTAPAAATSSQFNPTANMQTQSYTPQTREVNAATDTTQGQLNSILSTDSPLMQRARTLATQQMASRGLVNSSMNGEAGVAAMIDRATPIAGADASVYDARAKTNMDATNTAGMFNVGQNNQLVGQGLSIAAQMAGQKDQQQFASGEAALDRTQQTGIIDKQQAFTSAQAELDRALQVSQTDKSLAAQQALQTAQQNFAAVQADLDRTQQTDLAKYQVDAQAALQKTQQEFSAVQSQLDREQQTALTELQNQFNQTSASRDFAASTARGTLDSINSILADPKLKPDAKRAAINNIIAAANSTMEWAGVFYKTELPPVQSPG